MPGPSSGECYRFGEFTLLPRRRLLVRDGRPIALIPKYYDLLCLLVERRTEALDKKVIFDRIWPDVIVSDSALTQAIRTLRRALDDSPRSPRYIRTLSRRGYQFVFEPVVLCEDAGVSIVENGKGPDDEPVETLVDRLLGGGAFQALTEEERFDAAIRLHALGTADALARIEGKPGASRARALLRESRWDVPNAGEVPIVGVSGSLGTIAALVTMRLRDAARAASARLGTASTGGAVAGIVAGSLGGLALYLPGSSPATPSAIVALTIVGGVAGLFGAAVIGAGLAAAEVLARSQRRLALVVCGTLSGLVAGFIARLALLTVFGTIVGRTPAIGGPVEGAIVGCAAGIGYAALTRTPRGGGMATPRGRHRFIVALGTAACCGLFAATLGGLGLGTVSVTLDRLSQTYQGSQVGLGPLAPLLGEEEARPITRATASGFEGLLFGFGLALGLTRRPNTADSR